MRRRRERNIEVRSTTKGGETWSPGLRFSLSLSLILRRLSVELSFFPLLQLKSLSNDTIQ